MTSRTPLVSIVTPVLNGYRWATRCLDSVVTQDYPNLEHLLIDGGSTDGTLDILADYAGRFPGRVRFVTGPDQGPGHAWNIGLKQAAGEILGCIGVDDECEPGAIGEVARFFVDHPSADFVHGNCRVIEADGSVRMHIAPEFDYRRFVNTAIDIATPSAYYRRRAVERVGWLDACGDDFDLMLRIAKRHRIERMNRTLSTLRVYPGSAFNPADAGGRLKVLRDTYIVSRRHGGSRVSRIALRYQLTRLLHAHGLSAPVQRLKWISRGAARIAARST